MVKSCSIILALCLICSLAFGETTYKMRMNADTHRRDWVVDKLDPGDIDPAITESDPLSWLKATAQTGLTGDKTGSFAINTSGTLGAGAITGTSLIKSGGVSTEFLKADGSVDTTTYLSSIPDNYLLNTGDIGTGNYIFNGVRGNTATEYAFTLLGANGIAGYTKGQLLSFTAGAGISTTTDDVTGIGGDVAISAGDSGSLTYDVASTVSLADAGDLTLEGGSAGLATTSVSDAGINIFGAFGGAAELTGGAGTSIISTGTLTKGYGGTGGTASIAGGVGGTVRSAGTALAGNSGGLSASSGAGGFGYGLSGATVVNGGSSGTIQFVTSTGGSAEPYTGNNLAGATVTGGNSGNLLFGTNTGGTAKAQLAGKTAGNVARGGNSGSIYFTTGNGAAGTLGAVSNYGGKAGNMTFTAGIGGAGTTSAGTNADIIFKSYTTEIARFSNTAGAVGNFRLTADNQKIQLGAAQDSSMYYDGTNLVINPQVVGTGRVQPYCRPAANTTVIDLLDIRRLTSAAGHGGDNIGAGLTWTLEDASGNTEEAANIDAQFTTAAHATQISALSFGILGTNQIALLDGVLQPTTTNDIDLGTSSLFYKTAYINNIGVGITPTAYLHIAAGTATAGTAPLKFTTGAILGTPEVGVMEFLDGKLYFTNVVKQKVIDRSGDVKLDTTTLASSTTETTVYTADIGANALRAGNVLKLEMSGTIDEAAAADAVTIRVKIGGVTIATVVSPASGVTAKCWHISGIATVRSIGNPGSIAWHMDMNADTGVSETCGVSAVDTTAAENITVTAQWNNNKAGNIFTCIQGIMEYKN